MYTYLLVQRWRLYGEWPKSVAFSSEWQPRTMWDERASVRHQASIRLLFGVGPMDLPDGRRLDTIPLYGAPDRSKGIWLGSAAICQQEESIDIAMAYMDRPEQNEYDIGLAITSNDELPHDLLQANFGSFPAMIVGYIQLHFRTVALALTAPVVNTLGDGKLEMEGKVSVRVLPRLLVKVNELRDALTNFIETSSSMDDEARLRIQVATRRYLEALAEDDIIDQFCDFWECCEFVAKTWGSGSKDKRIAAMISNATGLSSDLLHSRIIEKLYRMRCNIVHDAIERYQELADACPKLELIARIMLSSCLGAAITAEDRQDLSALIASS